MLFLLMYVSKQRRYTELIFWAKVASLKHAFVAQPLFYLLSCIVRLAYIASNYRNQQKFQLQTDLRVMICTETQFTFAFYTSELQETKTKEMLEDLIWLRHAKVSNPKAFNSNSLYILCRVQLVKIEPTEASVYIIRGNTNLPTLQM